MPWRLSIRRKQHGLLSSFSAPRLEREMIFRYQLWFGLLFVLHSFVPCATSAQEVLPAPPIGMYVKNNFKDVQIAFLGRITKVLQYGWFKGPRVRVGNRYDQAKIEYTLESFSIDEVFKGADLIKGKRDLLIAQSDFCHMWACAGSHSDNDEELRASERLLADRGQSVFLFCWSQGNDTDFMSGFLLRLRGELRKRGHSYDFAIFQNCSLANSEKPQTLSIVRSYFGARQGAKP